MQVEMTLQYSPYIEGIPLGKEAAWNNAVRNDGVTVKTWEKQWIEQTKVNSGTHDFIKDSAYQVFEACAGRPVILAGAGPSLSRNWKDLIGDGDRSIGRQDVRMVTNVHNFPFMEDRNLMRPDDFYLILDAGDICIKEMSEGGAHADTPDWYWQKTENRTLVAYHGTHPDFIKRWRGPILWYTTPCASEELAKEIFKIVDISKVPGFNVGGNVMGAALYFSRAILGCSVPIFVGMDLCFSYDHKFHAWDCWYNEKFSGVIPWIDVFGNRVWTWQSYFGFKNWFDFMACGGTGNNPQLWINATEGGIMGAYHEGNIKQILQMDLKSALQIFCMYKRMPSMLEKSVGGKLHLLF